MLQVRIIKYFSSIQGKLMNHKYVFVNNQEVTLIEKT